MNRSPKSLALAGVLAFLSLSAHACIIEELPVGGGEGGAAGGAPPGEGGAAAAAPADDGGAAGAAGARAAAGAGAGGGAGEASAEGGAGGQGVVVPHPCDTPVCEPGAVERETAPCGECSDMITRSRTCNADTCTWGAWGAWSTCAAECQPNHWRCCGAGKWEWCLNSTCRWTGDCATCSSSNCDCS